MPVLVVVVEGVLGLLVLGAPVELGLLSEPIELDLFRLALLARLSFWWGFLFDLR